MFGHTLRSQPDDLMRDVAFAHAWAPEFLREFEERQTQGNLDGTGDH